jgi:sugar/nucleoside kinase (ribokinase family)
VGKPSSGVVAVGALAPPPAAETSDAPAPGAAGSALLAAVGAWLAGRDAAICAVIGPDVSTELIRRLTKRGIDLSRSRSIAEAGTQTETEPLVEQLASVSPNWSVHLCGLSPARQRELIRAVSGRVMSVTIDTSSPATTTSLDRDAIVELASNCDAFLAGRHQLERLWPGEPPREILRLLARSGARAALIKLGAGGSIGIREGRISWMSAFPLTRPASLPGGDAYAGAFSAVFGQDRNLARAMAWATAAASAVMQSASPLDLLTEFGRQVVESRARALERDTRATS